MGDKLTWTNERRKLSDLVPWEHNPRQIKKAEAARLVESLDTFGQIQTIAVGPDNEVYDGHQRKLCWAASEKFGADYEVDVRVSSRALTERERQQLVVFLHRGTMGDWDWDKLANFDVPDLLTWGFSDMELGLAGFTLPGDEPPEDPGPQIDKAAELQEKWGVKLGDVWKMGGHFAFCGDCREPDAWQRLLGAAGVKRVNGVFTSPPYAEQRKAVYGGISVDEYIGWWESVQGNVRDSLADRGSFFVNIKPHCEDGERVLYVFDLVLAMKRRWGWRFVDELCWKRVTSPGRWPNRFKNLFEPVYHFSLGDCVFRPTNVLRNFKEDASDYHTYDPATAKRDRPSGFDTVGSMKSPHFDGALPGNIIEASGAGGDGHWAAFPIALPGFFVRAYSDTADAWIDPFLGSGTTIMAAHRNGRRGLGIEIEPKYIAVTLQRFLDMTGVEPVLVSG